MNKVEERNFRRERAHQRVRSRVSGSAGRPRLAVHKSLRYVYAQVIDDQLGTTLAQANSREGVVRAGTTRGAASKEAARRVGQVVAERAKEKGISKVVFDRGGYIYHGLVREVAEGAREKGLEF